MSELVIAWNGSELAHQARKVVPLTALPLLRTDNARTSRKKIADILSTEVKNIKERYPHFELEIEQDATRTPVLIKQERK